LSRISLCELGLFFESVENLLWGLVDATLHYFLIILVILGTVLNSVQIEVKFTELGLKKRRKKMENGEQDREKLKKQLDSSVGHL
jgi:uncharacterized damage-inducible protein DinB